MMTKNMLISVDDPILVTGAAGFIGPRVVGCLLERGFNKIRCFVRTASDLTRLEGVIDQYGGRGRAEISPGNLLSREDCSKLTRGISLIYHLAAGRGQKSFAEAFLNSVVTTRNLLDATLEHSCLRRFVNVSSFVVYTNRNKPHGRLLDESCPLERHPESRYEAYCYAKVKQDEMVNEYGRKHMLPYVHVRPGTVYGPWQAAIPGRVGTDTFGVFIHMGGPNPLPLAYVDNCAEAIVLAGLKSGIDGETFNVVDDDLPSSRRFLRLYKRNVKRFRSIYLPHFLAYTFCVIWEKYSAWSKGQLPARYTRREWAAYWKKTRYSNRKIKEMVSWSPRVSMEEGLSRYFESCRNGIARG